MPHYDAPYKALFSHPEMVLDLLRGLFQESWVAGLEMRDLEKVNAHYVSMKYRRRESDMVWRIRVNEEWIYLYVLLEFQSRVDNYMAIRLMTYIGLLYEDLIKSKSFQKKALPPILPCVIYMGEQPWTAAIHAQDLLHPTVPLDLKRYFPAFEYCLLDLGHMTEWPEDNILSPLIELEQTVTRREEANPVFLRLLKLLELPKYEQIKLAFMRYVGFVLNLEVSELNEIPVDPKERNLMLAQRIRARDEMLIKTAKREGREEGLQRGIYQTLLTILEQRFGALPSQLTEYLQSIPANELLLFSKHAVQAESIDELFYK